MPIWSVLLTNWQWKANGIATHVNKHKWPRVRWTPYPLCYGGIPAHTYQVLATNGLAPVCRLWWSLQTWSIEFCDKTLGVHGSPTQTLGASFCTQPATTELHHWRAQPLGVGIFSHASVSESNVSPYSPVATCDGTSWSSCSKKERKPIVIGNALCHVISRRGANTFAIIICNEPPAWFQHPESRNYI